MSENTTKNIYQKLNEGRNLLKSKPLKGSGKNEFVGFTYVELGDILPTITKIENDLNYITIISYDKELAYAKVVNIDEPYDFITISCPMSTASLKGCHEVQNLGAVQTYLRRYLYFTLYEVVENDVLDETAGKDEKPEKATEKQIGLINSYLNGIGKKFFPQFLDKYGPVEELDKKTASTIIDGIMKSREEMA